MPAGSLSAPPLMTPGPMILATSAQLRCSRATSRAVRRLVAVRRRVISDTRRDLRRARQRPVAARLFLWHPANGERGGFIDAHHEDCFTAVDASLYVIDVLVGQQLAQPLSAGPIDDCLVLGRDTAMHHHELARKLGRVTVRERG